MLALRVKYEELHSYSKVRNDPITDHAPLNKSMCCGKKTAIQPKQTSKTSFKCQWIFTLRVLRNEMRRSKKSYTCYPYCYAVHQSSNTDPRLTWPGLQNVTAFCVGNLTSSFSYFHCHYEWRHRRNRVVSHGWVCKQRAVNPNAGWFFLKDVIVLWHWTPSLY